MLHIVAGNPEIWLPTNSLTGSDQRLTSGDPQLTYGDRQRNPTFPLSFSSTTLYLRCPNTGGEPTNLVLFVCKLLNLHKGRLRRRCMDQIFADRSAAAAGFYWQGREGGGGGGLEARPQSISLSPCYNFVGLVVRSTLTLLLKPTDLPLPLLTKRGIRQ